MIDPPDWTVTWVLVLIISALGPTLALGAGALILIWFDLL